MEIQDTNLSGMHDGSYSLQTRPVVVLLVLAMFDEATVQDVVLELRSTDEMVVRSVRFTVFPRSRSVCIGRERKYI